MTNGQGQQPGADDRALEALRGIVRPVVTLATTAIILAAFWKIAIAGTLPDDLSREVIVFVLGSGTMMLGMWFGGRSGNGR